MRWPNTCDARPDDGGDTDHCYHVTGPVHEGHAELVCCWCGDLFLSEERRPAEHGEYARGHAWSPT